MYLGIKHSHLFFITMTFILFNLRFWLRTMKPEKPLPSALRFMPHINDTLLLFSGMMLMQIGHWQPFGASKWREAGFGAGIYYIGRDLPAQPPALGTMVRAVCREPWLYRLHCLPGLLQTALSGRHGWRKMLKSHFSSAV